MPWYYAVYLALQLMSTQRKNQAHKRGVNNQNRIMAEDNAKRLALEKRNTAKQKELLNVVGKDNVSKDSVVDSQRISALMNKLQGAGVGDKLISKNAPQIVQDSMKQAMGDVSTNVSQNGMSKAQLQALTGQFDKYNPDFADAETLAKNIASKLKGNAGVRDIRMREAGDTYDQGGDMIGQIAKLFGMYAMSQGGGDTKVVEEDADLTAQSGNNSKYSNYTS
jgi:hypothetical protein